MANYLVFVGTLKWFVCVLFMWLALLADHWLFSISLLYTIPVHEVF